MKVRLNSTDLQELLVERLYPAKFNPDNSIVEHIYPSDTIFGTGFFKELYFEGVHIGYGDISLIKPTEIFSESDMEVVEMHFTLCGDILTKDNYTGNSFEFTSNHHNITYSNGFKGLSQINAKSKMQFFEVNLLPSFFNKYLPDNSKAFENFRNHLHQSRQAQLNQHNLYITPQMLFVIKEIMNSQQQGAFKKMFIEAKVIELLMLQLEQMSSAQDDTFSTLKKSDIDKMYEVKEII